MHDLYAQVLAEHIHHHLAFIKTQQAVIDKHARQLITDSTMNECRCDAAVNATREPQDHFFRTDLLAYGLDRLGDIIRHA